MDDLLDLFNEFKAPIKQMWGGIVGAHRNLEVFGAGGVGIEAITIGTIASVLITKRREAKAKGNKWIFYGAVAKALLLIGMASWVIGEFYAIFNEIRGFMQ